MNEKLEALAKQVRDRHENLQDARAFYVNEATGIGIAWAKRVIYGHTEGMDANTVNEVRYALQQLDEHNARHPLPLHRQGVH